MRWVNHHSHPGDNRYRVFVFRESDHASRFAERLTAAGIGYERHEEDGEVMFGVAKTYDSVTIRENNLRMENSATLHPTQGMEVGIARVHSRSAGTCRVGMVDVHDRARAALRVALGAGRGVENACAHPSLGHGACRRDHPRVDQHMDAAGGHGIWFEDPPAFA